MSGRSTRSTQRTRQQRFGAPGEGARLRRVERAIALACLGLACACGDAGIQASKRTSASGQDCAQGVARPLTRVRFMPAPGRAERMVGGTIQGSNLSATNGFVDLATVTQAPPEGEFSELTVPNHQLFRYVKYHAPENSHGNVAELEFYAGEQLLEGAPFGSAGSTGESEGAGFEAALDGEASTFFDGSLASGNYVGFDLGHGATVAAPSFSPPPGNFEKPPSITLSSDTDNVTIRYTTDGSNPSRDHGELWSKPIKLKDGRTQLKAMAFADCLFDSPVAAQAYAVGDAVANVTGQKSYHIGNSLTDTINPWLEPIADSTGVDHVYARWTIPGAPPVWLWDHKRDGFEDPAGASDFDNFVRSFAPIDHMSVQPFSDPNLETQGEAGRKMYAAALAHSPDLQFWIYAQWPSFTGWPEDGLAKGAPFQAPPEAFPPAPNTWEEATQNQLLFHELYREYVDERAEGKTVLIVPAGLALVELKRQIEAGKIAGITDFYGQHFSDDLHLSAKGQYLVALVFYACLYRESPEGQVTFSGTGLTEEQARSYQRIAWQTASAYRWSGIEGTP